MVAENNVPKTILRSKAYFSKNHIDRLFSARKENPEITEWYSVEDIRDKYGMTLSAIYTLVSKIGIPKRKEGPKVYYSKYHFDVAKGAKSAEDVDFISVPEAMEKKEKLRSGKLSLYLDYYPPIWNPHIKKMSRREFLGLYLIGKPKDKFELDYNEEIMLKARGIRATRELAIINEEFGFLDRTKKQADFCNGRCLMKDVTIGLCNDIRTYILKIRVKQSGNIISRNSAAGYWSTFRALLKLAYKEEMRLLNATPQKH